MLFEANQQSAVKKTCSYESIEQKITAGEDPQKEERQNKTKETALMVDAVSSHSGVFQQLMCLVILF